MPFEEQAWFEFSESKRRRYDTQVWIPLHSQRKLVESGEHGKAGYREDFLLAASLMVSVSQRETALDADANDLINTSHATSPYVDSEGNFIQADTAANFYDSLTGIRLVLEQRIPGDEYPIWHLNQDFVFGLNLYRSADAWFRVEEGRTEVARLLRDASGKPVMLEVKAEYLKDYLAARNAGLILGTYQERIQIGSNAPGFNWEQPIAGEQDVANHWRWEGAITKIHEGGMPFGEKMTVLHMSRSDFDAEDEVPALEIGGAVETKQWEVNLGQGAMLYRVAGALWRTQWITPAAHSPRVKSERVASTSYFIFNAAGDKKSGSDLEEEGNLWLWFRPEIVNDALSHPDGQLIWYTGDTGNLRFAPDQGVHFGVNELGYINVLAVDIGRLPLWSQAKWAAHNVAPSGKVSRELISVQVEVSVPQTIAPESDLKPSLDALADAIKQRYGIKLFRGDEHEERLLRSIHRFRSVNTDGLLDLAKDIARVFADRIDAKALQKAAIRPQPEKPLGSLKSLEGALATLIPTEDARKLCGALFGIYDLRVGASHLPPSDLSEALKLANVESGEPPVRQGFRMLIAFVVTLRRLAAIFSGA